MFKFTVYAKEENCAVFNKMVEVEPTDVEGIKEVRETAKSKKFWVAPADADSAYVLMQSTQGRRSNWTNEMVELAHKLRVNENASDLKIQLEILQQFEVEVSSDSVKKTLRQEANTEVALEDGLREKAVVATPAKQGRGSRKRMTKEIEEGILADFDAGMNGVAIGEKYGFSNSHVNSFIRKNRGYRKAVA